jgi:hypothetical protein
MGRHQVVVIGRFRTLLAKLDLLNRIRDGVGQLLETKTSNNHVSKESINKRLDGRLFCSSVVRKVGHFKLMVLGSDIIVDQLL